MVFGDGEGDDENVAEREIHGDGEGVYKLRCKRSGLNTLVKYILTYQDFTT